MFYRTIIILTVFFLYANTINAQTNCISSDILLSNQAEVNNFVSTYSLLSCNQIDGNLEITGNITDLSGLSFLNYITGDLYLHQLSSVTNISGLNNLYEIGGSLMITSNVSLLSVSLFNLSKIGYLQNMVNYDSLLISDNQNLTLINFSNLEYILKDFNINNNVSVNLLFFEKLKFIDGNLYINDNGSLSDCCMVLDFKNNIKYLNGLISIYNNAIGCNSLFDIIDSCELIDTDGDSIIDSQDNCPNAFNPTQIDLNNNNVGDACELNCSLGNVTLNNALAVNNFIANYKDVCTQIDGDLTITGNVNDISGLSFLLAIDGDLKILNTNLSSISGLSNIESNLTGLIIRDNHNLISINGLQKVTAINGHVNIANNTLLNNIDGLQNITTANSVEINSQFALNNLSGLNNLITITYDLNIHDSTITKIEFNNLQVANRIFIQNVETQSLSGFNNLINCNKIYIYDNDLINLNGFINLNKTNDLRISNNNNLELILGFSSLRNIGDFDAFVFGELEISHNDSLLNLNGFSNLKSIYPSLFIANNYSLPNLYGFRNVERIANLYLVENYNTLNDISDLENLNELSSLVVDSNNELNECCIIQTFQDTNVIDSTSIFINNNNTDCSTLLAVTNHCKDSDLDGIVDNLDNCDNDINLSQEDDDGDGIGDICDNCPNTANASQTDTDGDGIGDACEPLAGSGTPGVGIGTLNPFSKLQINDGDIYVDNKFRGIILKAKNDKCYRIQVNNKGEFNSKEITCPQI